MARRGDTKAIVIGGSAGALEALGALLSALPPGYSLPIAVVVHVPAHRPSSLAAALQPHCAVEVREAEDKEPFAPGAVYVAPADYHLLLDEGPRVALSVDAPVNYSIPSIDVLFESAASVLGSDVAGVVLSGANADGARGLRAIEDAGGVALVQAPQGAATPAMPEAAIRACRAARALPLRELGEELVELGRRRS